MIILTLLLFAAGAALLVLARKVPGFAPFYSTNVYPLLESTLGRLCGIVSFSVAEGMVLLLAILLIIDFLLNIHSLLTFVKHVLFLASLLLFLYAANCGVNYYNTPFVDPASLTAITQPVDSNEKLELLEDYCGFVVGKLKESSDAGKDSGTFTYPDDENLAEAAVSAMTKLGTEYPRLSGYYPIPKRIIVSRPFSMSGVTGIYSPFTIEANYNGEMTAYNKP
ncbi:MAG: DUF3810 family protein, partial [Eubacterium sp.]|nr:DUF3810 family protein [Eubacterium sp.]